MPHDDDDHDHDHDHGHKHDHNHDHAHPHRHPQAPDDPLPPKDDMLLEQAVRELLISKGVLTAEVIHRQIDAMDSRNPALGAKVVARVLERSAFP